MPSLVVTLVGLDRPGLVGSVSDVIQKHNGNWLESRMAHLAGQFAGIVLVDVPEANTEALIGGLNLLSSQGLKVVTELDTAKVTDESADPVWLVNVVGNDRPGIVREVAQVLASHDVNVEELTTECDDAPQGGGQIFTARAQLRLPEGLTIELLQDELERLATDLMIDFTAIEGDFKVD
ncbi:MAG TPA: ACT domain-containing protein [Planctomycetes bacterium]|nr:ACT domain-containing protein [Fuerstiella sp.]HIK96457.1 ACT domain-containing protein [Planctomycetota bacterium]